MGRTLELVNKLKIAMLRLNVTVSRLLGWVKI